MSTNEVHLQGHRELGLGFECALAVLGFLVLAWMNQAFVRREVAWVPPVNEREIPWNPEAVRFLSMSHESTLVDALLLKNMGDPSYQSVSKGSHAPLYYDLDLASELDPDFFELYLMGGWTLSIQRNDLQGALHLLQKGMNRLEKGFANLPTDFEEKFWPQSWRLPMTLAYVYLFEFHQLPEAARYYRLAGQHPGAPDFLKRLDIRFQTFEGIYETGLRLVLFQRSNYRALHGEESLKLADEERAIRIGWELYRVNQKWEDYCKKKRTCLKQEWEAFSGGRKMTDPYGGVLHWLPSKKIGTTTLYEPTLGMPY